MGRAVGWWLERVTSVFLAYWGIQACVLMLVRSSDFSAAPASMPLPEGEVQTSLDLVISQDGVKVPFD